MKVLFKNVLFLIILACTCLSCRVEKRLYRKGYHVVWEHKKVERSSSHAQTPQLPSHTQAAETPEVMIVSASKKTEQEIVSTKSAASLLLGKDTCGDVIYLKNGEKINVKVLEVDHGFIKYKRCDNLDGPLFTVKKSSLAMLQYYNGIKEDLQFEAESVPYSPSKNFVEKKTNGLGLASFICVLAGFFLFFPFFIGMPLALASLQQFKREPDKYSDKWMPRTTLIISAIVYFLTAFVAALVAAFVYETAAVVVAIAALILGIICVIPLGSSEKIK